MSLNDSIEGFQSSSSNRFLSFNHTFQAPSHNENIMNKNNNTGSHFNPHGGFDFVAQLASSPIFENPYIKPKILKMIETVQANFDLTNEKLIDQIGRQREHEHLELSKKLADLNHRQKLQSMLLEAINECDFQKANYINEFLNPLNTPNSINTQSCSQAKNVPLFADMNSSLAARNNNHNNIENADADLCQMPDNGFVIKNEANSNESFAQTSGNDSASCSIEYGELDEDKNAHDSEMLTNNINESLKEAFAKVRRPNPLSPIRHLICSPGLEAKLHNSRISILFRGDCNGICYQNKPWSKEQHIHYIINSK